MDWRFKRYFTCYKNYLVKKKPVAVSLISKAPSIATVNNQLFSIDQYEYFSMLKKLEERIQLVLK